MAQGQVNNFRVQVDIAGEVDQPRWEERVVDATTLEQVVSLVANDTTLTHNLRRLQCDVPATDHAAMVALYRCGFWRGGRLRSAPLTPSGYLVDVLIYVRLAMDPVCGPHGFSGVMSSVLPTKRVIARVVFHDETGRALPTETAYEGDWEPSGRMADPDESPRTGGRRELLKGIDLNIALDESAITDRMPSHLGWGGAIEFIYDGGALPGTIARCLAPRDWKLRTIHWVPCEELPGRVSGLSARRINLLLDGYRGATENGTRIP